MEIKSEITLKGSVWSSVDHGYRRKIFETQWDIFKICLAIGILYDKQLENEKNEDEEGLNIPVKGTISTRCSVWIAICFGKKIT